MRRVLRRVFLASLPRTSREPAGSPRARTPLGLVPLEDRVVPATYVVMNTADSGPNSLRAAVGLATAPGDTITFASDVTGTITLASELLITNAVTIAGPGAKALTVSGNNVTRVFDINSPAAKAAVAISGLTITAGTSPTGGGGVFSANDDFVSLTGVVVSASKATGTSSGGGVYIGANGFLQLVGSTVSGNTAAGSGGGVYFFVNGSFNIVGSTVSGNTASGAVGGGGVYFYGGISATPPTGFTASTATVTNSTISGNTAANGGGIMMALFTGNLLLQDSTVTGNTANATTIGGGGGINLYAYGTGTLANSVVSGNTNAAAADVYSYYGTLNANNSFIGNQAGLTIAGTNNNAPTVTDAKLGPLADNGGPTLTHAPLPGSPLLNAGSNALIAPGVTTDQRGVSFVRIFGTPNAVDIGAVEVQPSSVVSVVPSTLGPTNAPAVTFAVTFNQPLAGLTAANFALAAPGLPGAAIQSVTPNATNTVWTVAVGGYSGTGTLQLKLANATGTAGVLNPNTPAATSPVVAVDTVRPVFASLTYAGTTPTNAAALTFTAVFSEPVNLTAANFVVTRGGTLAGGPPTVTPTATPGLYTITVPTGTGDGPLTLALSSFAGLADPAGNTVLGTAPAPITVVVDKTAPTLAGIAAVPPTRTSASQVLYTVTFSEPVTGLAASDFTVATAGTLTGVSVGTPVATATPGVYTVPVNTAAGDGTVTLSLATAGTVRDIAGNSFVLAAPLDGPTFTVIRSNAVLDITPAGPPLTNATTVFETVRFNVAVAGLTAANFALTTTGGVTGQIGTPTTADNMTFTVPVLNVTGTASDTGTLRLDFLNGNGTNQTFANTQFTPVPFAGSALTVDQRNPTVVGFTRLDPATTNLPSVRYLLVLDEAVIGLSAADFAAVSSDGAAAGIPTVTGFGTTYIVTVPSGPSNGTLRLDFVGTAGAADAAGNGIAGLPRPGDPYTLLVVPPKVTAIALAGPPATSADLVQFVVTFSQPVGGVSLANFALAATTGGSSLVGVTGSGTTYVVTAATGSGDGVVGLTLSNPAGITDATGQPVGNTFVGPGYAVIKSPPRVVGFTPVTPAATNGGTAEFTLTFNQDVAGLDASDIFVSAPGIAGASVVSVTGSGTTYDLVLSLGSGDGTVRPDLIDDDSIVSLVSGLPLGGAGLGNGNFAGPTISVNRSGPAVAVAPAPGQAATVTLDAAGKAAPIQFAVTFSAPVTGFTADAVILAGPGSGGFVTVSGSGANYVVTVNNASGVGTFTVGVRAGAAFDPVGNPSLAANTAAVATVAPVPPPVFVDPTPVASADGFITPSNRPLAVAAASGLLANDSSPVGARLTAVLLAAPPASQGVLALDPDGGFRFTPARGFLGLASFTYAARDAAGSSSGPIVATVRVSSRTTFTAAAAGPGGGPMVTIYNADGTVLRNFYAYDPSFTGGVRVAVGDVNGDGVDDIVTAAGPGGAAHIRAFDARTGEVIRSFYAYDPSFTGGAYVAVGDVDGDGYADIVTGAGAGGGPHVQVFSGLTGQTITSFFAYVPDFTGGVQVAAGDLTGDGKADIVTGAASGGSHVQAYDGATGALIRNFFAYDPTQTGGVTVAVGDVNSDGIADIVTGSGADARVRLYDGRTTKFLTEKPLDIPFLTGGVRVAMGDSSGNGQFDRLLVVPVGSAAPTVRRFTLPGLAPVDAVSEFPGDFSGGLYVG